MTLSSFFIFLALEWKRQKRATKQREREIVFFYIYKGSKKNEVAGKYRRTYFLHNTARQRGAR